MFYISQINRELDDIKYGITDTKDGVLVCFMYHQ